MPKRTLRTLETSQIPNTWKVWVLNITKTEWFCVGIFSSDAKAHHFKRSIPDHENTVRITNHKIVSLEILGDEGQTVVPREK